jgi:hypothetical protein
MKLRRNAPVGTKDNKVISPTRQLWRGFQPRPTLCLTETLSHPTTNHTERTHAVPKSSRRQNSVQQFETIQTERIPSGVRK